MAQSKWKLLKENLIQLLNDKNNYEDTDDYLIDELVFNLQQCEICKRDIKKIGQKVNVRRDGDTPYFQLNLSLAAYNQFVKNITTIYTRLGVSPAERKKLKITGEKSLSILDEFDENE